MTDLSFASPKKSGHAEATVFILMRRIASPNLPEYAERTLSFPATCQAITWVENR
jgi:hypothetical protein